ILDLDDTLIDHHSAEQNAARLFGEEHAAGIPDYDESGFVQRWHDIAELHLASFLRGEIDFQEQRRRRIRTLFKNPQMFDDDADVLFGRFLRQYQASWIVFPDVIEFLERHQSEGLSVLSDGSQKQQEKKLTRTGISHFFSFVFTSESTGLSKPNPRLFRHVCCIAGVNAGETSYIGDSLEKDALGASDAGLRGVWLNRNAKPAPEGIESISSLRDYIPIKYKNTVSPHRLRSPSRRFVINKRR
ncbi:MAG: HAD family hydrolase, partial [Verrucomicrobia bacterium]|nr:HAD family hydrolase [Verrucomicrobiota bacterium]